ncbi:hypothetical protein BU23DRAFT_478973, partial [Bimuria novae-zelandiae CBS 107.79]
EDNNLLYSIKLKYNVTRIFKISQGVRLFIHLGRSPDLNPTEGCWLILKEKAKRRLHKPCKGETP